MTTNKLTPEQQAVVAAATRWCGNILVEVLGNHGKHMTPENQKRLSTAIQMIHEMSL